MMSSKRGKADSGKSSVAKSYDEEKKTQRLNLSQPQASHRKTGSRAKANVSTTSRTSSVYKSSDVDRGTPSPTESQQMASDVSTWSGKSSVNKSDMGRRTPSPTASQLISSDMTDSVVTGLPHQKTKPFADRIAKRLFTFSARVSGDARVKASIVCSAFLPDGRLLLADYTNKKIKLFDDTFCYAAGKKFNNAPGRIAVYDKNEISVSSVNKKLVRIAADKDITINKTVSLSFQALGIDYISEDKLAIADASVPLLYVCNTNGDILSKIPTDTTGNPLIFGAGYVTVDRARSRAYISDFQNNAVYAIDLIGCSLCFIYKHAELNRPTGMDVDDDGNLYVCGGLSSTIHQVSKNGQTIKTILSKQDGVEGPHKISFTPSGETFTVVCGNMGAGEIVSVYSME